MDGRKKKDSWFKPNFWTLAYLEESGRKNPAGDAPVTAGGCLAAVAATVLVPMILVTLFMVYLALFC